MSIENKMETIIKLAEKAFEAPCQLRCFQQKENEDQIFWCVDITFKSNEVENLLDYSGACGMSDTLDGALTDLLEQLQTLPVFDA